MRRKKFTSFLLIAWGSMLLGTGAAWAAKPSATQALRLMPIQKDVDFDLPSGKAAEACTIQAEKAGGQAGWVVRDSNRRILRRFSDSNDDNVVDVWSYYKDGLEVYRDIDGNYNGKADQYRWFNTGGTRWGIDSDEDGRIDSWKQISAEETAAELVAALRERSIHRFARLLLDDKELKALAVSARTHEEISKKLAGAENTFGDLLAEQKVVDRDTKFVSFGATKPGLVPAGEVGEKDLMVYENAAALIQRDGKHGQIVIGTLIQVGDSWRLIDVPHIDEAAQASAAGYFFRTAMNVRPDQGEAHAEDVQNEALQKTMTELEKLDQAIAAASGQQQSKLNEQRADLLEKLVGSAEDQDLRRQWIRQLADTVSAAVQMGTYDDGVARLEQFERKLAASEAFKDELAYVKFRRLTAAYSRDLQQPKADFAKIQEQWLADLEAFTKEHPTSDDSAEAMLQLAIAQEFAGEDEKAKLWYARILKDFPDSAPGKKAAGAKRRLESVGQVLQLTGNDLAGGSVSLSDYRGKLVLIHYWATWCGPCKSDMEEIKELYAKYGNSGLSVIGINLDQDQAALEQYLASTRLPWKHIHEPGGLEGRLANELGILTLPTMLLIGEDGKVISRNIHISELQKELRDRLR